MSAAAPSAPDTAPDTAPDLAARHATAPTWAVVGASNDRAKFGNKIYRALRADGYTVYAVNLDAPSVEGDPAWPRVADLPAAPEVVNLVIPPGAATAEVVRQAAARGAKAVWFQPGAEDAAAIRLAAELGLDVVRDCILVRRSAPRHASS